MSASSSTPYSVDLGDRDPLEALAATPGRIRTVVERWPDQQFERSYAPGKWSARRILVHLAQTELALGARARHALCTDGYVAQPFAQDQWLELDATMPPAAARDVYTSLRQMNLRMFSGLTPAQQSRPFQHPEYGSLTVWWIACMLAGHDLRHLNQLATIE